MMDLSHVSRIDYDVVVTGDVHVPMVTLYNSQKISEKEVMDFLESSYSVTDYHPYIISMRADQFNNIFCNK